MQWQRTLVCHCICLPLLYPRIHNKQGLITIWFLSAFHPLTKSGSKRVNRGLAASWACRASVCVIVHQPRIFYLFGAQPLPIFGHSAKPFGLVLVGPQGRGPGAFSVLGGSQFPSSLTLLIHRNLLSPGMVDKWGLSFYMRLPGREFSMGFTERICPSWGWRVVWGKTLSSRVCWSFKHF